MLLVLSNKQRKKLQKMGGKNKKIEMLFWEFLTCPKRMLDFR
jgi:hypothetical protein